jgi:hypothetical protein
MTQEAKKAAWDELVEAGVKPTRHYRTYTQAELDAAVARVRAVQAQQAEEGPAFEFPPEFSTERAERIAETVRSRAPIVSTPDTVAGLRTNTHIDDDILRVEESGRIWYQDEVSKPAFAKPRGRRILEYIDSGVKKAQVQDGEFIETFEMPGDRNRVMQAKITLPSYQTGIYKDPGMPFKIHIYGEKRGFDYFEVNEFYGSRDLVPPGIKRDYVSSTLVYDIPSVIREIESEYREKVLRGEIRA